MDRDHRTLARRRYINTDIPIQLNGDYYLRQDSSAYLSSPLGTAMQSTLSLTAGTLDGQHQASFVRRDSAVQGIPWTTTAPVAPQYISQAQRAPQMIPQASSPLQSISRTPAISQRIGEAPTPSQAASSTSATPRRPPRHPATTKQSKQRSKPQPTPNPASPPRTSPDTPINQIDDLLRALDEGNEPPPSQTQTSPHKHPSATPYASGLRALSKARLYANSVLPPSLPPLILYLPTWPLVCTAARHALSVYTPSRRTSILQIPASALGSIKAMTIAVTNPHATSDAFVVAIRGSSSLSDWAVNLREAPTPPTGFLDDEGNLCHAGFLGVARATAPQLARVLVAALASFTPNASRKAPSLVLTGHSAGGAVAALLYAHMLAGPGVTSSLSGLAGRFRRVHCFTFGAPPVSLLPLARPGGPAAAELYGERQRGDPFARSLFFAFVNEGDPVARAEVAYARNLLALIASSPPPAGGRHVWRVPSATLSCAGRLVLLRGTAVQGQRKRGGLAGLLKKAAPVVLDIREGVEALAITDAQLRGVVFADLPAHSMQLYHDRLRRMAERYVVGDE